MTRVATLAILLCVFCAPARVHAYSVLAHEALVDAAWDDSIVPLIKRRFPRATADDILRARAFAYGGSVIQDLGYYPFGSHQFTNLVHYVRSGDFVEALLRDAASVDEFAFAIGALSHYTADTDGHPIAVNRSVPLVYPKDGREFGPVVTYIDDPKRHIMVEFGFDVVQVAGGAYLPDAYRRFIGFEVAKPLLERAFRETYGIEVEDLFLSTDLAIGTFRYAVSRTIPEMTRIAWRDKSDDIRKVSPNVQRNAFIYTFTREEYERAFGTSYRKPGLLARVLATLLKLVPKIGPFRTLAFRVPTPEAERLFTESFRTARDRFKAQLADARDGRIDLANADFDTGRPAAWGEYALADTTYVELLHKLSTSDEVTVPPALRQDILRFFDQPARTASSHRAPKRLSDKDVQRVRDELARLRQAA